MLRKISVQEGGEGFIKLTFEDTEYHGLVNGGHTALAIYQVREELAAEDPTQLQSWDAWVRLHIMQGVDEDMITDLAEGLNRSLQVDDPSLENLRGRFAEIKKQLEGKSGAAQIAYRQGDPGEIDVLQVLTFMGMMNLSLFKDRKSYPNKLFGHPKEVLRIFVEDSKKAHSEFGKILPHLHEILVLSDRIRQEGVYHLGKLKVNDSKKQNRVRSPKHKGRSAYFSGGTIDGNFPLGWLYPMLGAFRANISPSAWEKGTLEWLLAPEELLKAVIEEMSEIVKQEHTDNKEKPAEVGKKEAAYRACYGVVTMELAQRGLLT